MIAALLHAGAERLLSIPRSTPHVTSRWTFGGVRGTTDARTKTENSKANSSELRGVIIVFSRSP
jgi:hypothetical protein